MQRKIYALIIGCSLAGLLAARVLAKHFDLVTIIERDFFPRKTYNPPWHSSIPPPSHSFNSG